MVATVSMTPIEMRDLLIPLGGDRGSKWDGAGMNAYVFRSTASAQCFVAFATSWVECMRECPEFTDPEWVMEDSCRVVVGEALEVG